MFGVGDPQGEAEGSQAGDSQLEDAAIEASAAEAGLVSARADSIRDLTTLIEVARRLRVECSLMQQANFPQSTAAGRTRKLVSNFLDSSSQHAVPNRQAMP